MGGATGGAATGGAAAPAARFSSPRVQKFAEMLQRAVPTASYNAGSLPSLHYKHTPLDPVHPLPLFRVYPTGAVSFLSHDDEEYLTEAIPGFEHRFPDLTPDLIVAGTHNATVARWVLVREAAAAKERAAAAAKERAAAAAEQARKNDGLSSNEQFLNWMH